MRYVLIINERKNTSYISVSHDDNHEDNKSGNERQNRYYTRGSILEAFRDSTQRSTKIAMKVNSN